jgi:hypothetical protein
MNLESEIKEIAKSDRFTLGQNTAYALTYSKVVNLSIDYFTENDKECKQLNELMKFLEQNLGLNK